MLRDKFELLAPAGSFTILKAVIEAGADAVYVGGNRFGARAYANNFTEAELLEAIDYVHLYGKKLFLTVNTLIKNDELQESLYEYLLPYYLRGLDGVIVQDLGAVRFIRKTFPKLEIHTSTQMTVTGSKGAKLLQSIGAVRVVLARELSIKEMKEIQEDTGVELEAFVHGALCYCYSGQCLFSSMLGGRSGNRGRCAQPCRLGYTVCDSKKKTVMEDSYVLSLKDLCGVESLNQLADAGVYSLKIEGRMKQASYAAGVVSYYRACIDREGKVTKEDQKALYELGNRCGFTSTYFKQHNGKDMVTFVKPSYEKSNDELHQRMEAQYVDHQSKLMIIGHLTMKKGTPIELMVTLGDTVVNVQGQIAEAAQNKPLLPEDVKKRLMKTGDTSFMFKDFTLDMDMDLFVPVGALNQLRRDALNQLMDQILASYRRTMDMVVSEEGAIVTKQKDKKKETSYIASFEDRQQLKVILAQDFISKVYGDVAAYSASDFVAEIMEDMDKAKERGKEFHLILPAIMRNSSMRFYQDKIMELIRGGIHGFVVKNYESLQFLRELTPELLEKITITADHNLYSYNDSAKEELADLGVDNDTIPLELNRKEIFGRNNENSQMIFYGHAPLMVTAGCVHKNTQGCDKTPQIMYLKDRYKVYFPVKNHCKDCYNVVYNSLPTLLFKEQKELEEKGVRAFRFAFTLETKDEVSKVFDIFQGKGQAMDSTRGHYKRGVE